MRVAPAAQRQTVTILLHRFVRVLARPLALSRLVAARLLLLAGKHKVLLTGDAPAPHERGDDQERQHRVGESAEHDLLSLSLRQCAAPLAEGVRNVSARPRTVATG